MKGMLDTSVLIGMIPEHVIDEIDQYAASFIVRAELLRGLHRFDATPELQPAARIRRQRIAALDDLPEFWLAFDADASEAYAQLTATSESAIRTKDALIAAHAVALGVPLLTADRGFTRFANADVIFV